MYYLIPKYQAFCLADEYADFIGMLAWYRMYCANRCGSKKKDYAQGFSSLKQTVDNLKHGMDQFTYIFSPVNQLFASIETILKKRSLDAASIQEIANLLYEFESEKEQQFREKYLEAALEKAARTYYSRILFDTVHDLFEAESNDAIVMAAFKYLDNHLQQLLQIAPHESYGEDLINRAFAPNSGAIQLNTHANEQLGLRNFFSGTNALFRNPSAHRSLFRGEHAVFPDVADSFAAAVVAMADMMAKMATRLYARKIEPEIVQILKSLATRRSWNQFVYVGTTLWCVGNVTEPRSNKLHDYRIQVFISADQMGLLLSLRVHPDVIIKDRTQLKESLQAISGLRVNIIEVASQES